MRDAASSAAARIRARENIVRASGRLGSGVLQQLCPVLGRKRLGPGFEGCLRLGIKLGRRRGAGLDRDTDLAEEVLLAGGRTGAEQHTTCLTSL